MPAYQMTDSRSGGRPRIAWLVMAVLVSWAGCALAADAVPNLTGAWKGTGQTVGSGQRTHAKPTTKPTFVSVKLTIRVQQQQGRVFYGIKQSSRASEQLVGVIGPGEFVRRVSHSNTTRG
jgi:hypothetical protein